MESIDTLKKRGHMRPARILRLCAGIVTCAAALFLTTCPDSSSIGIDTGSRTPITSGTISGFAFTVIDGKVYQDNQDVPIDADDEGGIIVFDEDTTGLGMSNPYMIQLWTEFSLESDGRIVPAAKSW